MPHMPEVDVILRWFALEETHKRILEGYLRNLSKRKLSGKQGLEVVTKEFSEFGITVRTRTSLQDPHPRLFTVLGDNQPVIRNFLDFVERHPEIRYQYRDKL